MADSMALKTGDTLPPFQVEITLPEGYAVGDIDNVQFILEDASEVEIVNQPMTQIDTDPIRYEYPWALDGSETDTAGTYKAEIEVTMTDTRIISFPTNGFWTVTMYEQLGSAP